MNPSKTVSNIPLAPAPQDFYTFLNKGKPVGAPKGGDDLGDLLNAADEDLVFEPG